MTPRSFAFILPDESSEAADALVTAARSGAIRLLTATHAALEMGEALNRARRRGRVTSANWDTALAILEELPLQYVPVDISTRAVSTAAAQVELSCYDAAYLLLAQRLGGRLATADASLAAASARAGILWEP